MHGLYVHIPFCRRACTYCDFYFTTALGLREAFVEALLRELPLALAAWPGRLSPLHSLYLGGGTPSLLTLTELERLLEAVTRQPGLQPGAELTLEANPDDLTEGYLQGLRALGINRLSMGLQSLNDHELSWMNRTHTARQGLEAVQRARDAGFDNLSLDYLLHTPWLDEPRLDAELDALLALQPEHLSVYGLTVEPRTRLEQLLQRGELPAPPEEAFARQYVHLSERLTAAGFEGYELSNWAQPGRRARHNSGYWYGQPWLGLGPSAHSYDGHQRWRNRPQLKPYIGALARAELPRDAPEVLGPRERYNELVLMRLRLAEGLPLAEAEALAAPQPGLWPKAKRQAGDFARRGLLTEADGHWRLTLQGRLWADALARDLFWD